MTHPDVVTATTGRMRTAQLHPHKGFLHWAPTRPFPDRAASLLPGSLATTRAGLAPAGDDELLIRS